MLLSQTNRGMNTATDSPPLNALGSVRTTPYTSDSGLMTDSDLRYTTATPSLEPIGYDGQGAPLYPWQVELASKATADAGRLMANRVDDEAM